MEDYIFWTFVVEIGDRWKDAAGKQTATLTKD